MNNINLVYVKKKKQDQAGQTFAQTFYHFYAASSSLKSNTFYEILCALAILIFFIEQQARRARFKSSSTRDGKIPRLVGNK